jgi:DNA-binding transcriptional LysR family regulator
MNTLRAMEVFDAVATNEGFAAAARALNISTTAVSRYVQEFEDWVGAEVFRRTTRRISLTEAGNSVLPACRQILAEVAAIPIDRQSETSPRGSVRITAPVFIARRVLGPLATPFLNNYPDVELDVVALDRGVDLVKEGFDLSIRIGALADSTLISRKLRAIELVLVASPDYLVRRGSPQCVKDLQDHNCIIDTVPGYRDRWPVRDESSKRDIRVTGNVTANNGEIAELLALSGAGIALLPDFFVVENLRDGRLVRLLEDAQSPEFGMYLLYPQTRHLPTQVRAFIDFLVGHVAQIDVLYNP